MVVILNCVDVVGSLITVQVIALVFPLPTTYAVALIVYKAPEGCVVANVRVTSPTPTLVGVIVTPLVLVAQAVVPLFAIKAQAYTVVKFETVVLVEFI